MKKIWNVAIIEDHPIVAQAYKAALEEFSSIESILVKIHEFNNLKLALECLNQNSVFENFDLLFLDIRFPGPNDGTIHSGEDLGLEIRQKFPQIKILIATGLCDGYRIHSILQSIDPEGFLVKNDITHKELSHAIKKILLDDSPFYSKTVLQLMKKQIHQNISLDKIDRKFLFELSMGTKMKDLPKILNLSIGGVERRKRNLRIIFDVEEEGDRALVIIAKEKGFL